jgi:hypothetical protein
MSLCSALRRACLAALAVSVPAQAWHDLRVPQDQPTIQAAVDAAQPGQRIVVSHGRFCGATLTKRVTLVGKAGATIIGCPDPAVGALRVGFFLPDGASSGSSIGGFTFDGQGVSNADLTPLAAGILARSAHQVSVVGNTFLGTVQAITNTDGSHWQVLFNSVQGLTALTCDGQCAGGDGIVFQQRLDLTTRPRGNLAAFNSIQGTIPDGLSEFSVVGVFLLGQRGSIVLGNALEIPDNPAADAEGVGILISDQCCAAVVTSTSIDWRVLFNDGRRSQIAVQVSPDVHGGRGNLQGGLLLGNRGRIELPPLTAAAQSARFALGPSRATRFAVLY